MAKAKYYPMGFDVRRSDGRELEIFLCGRNRWGLERLIEAGSDGITSFQFAGVRVSAFVHYLKGIGVDIETITERHEGLFAGNHARYRLTCSVTPKGSRLL
ncbi:winged helix domain-containing protein [Aliiroseovarius sp. KMU-71]|uniref:winged helix domain-containing protein n=1 Tax=Aliiroseovarius sp. KMU-71 TaxID=3453123 RepID=UPI003F48901F